MWLVEWPFVPSHSSIRSFNFALLFTIWGPDKKRRLSFEHAAGFILSTGLSPCSPICLPASRHFVDLNEVVRVSNRRWWSFSCTETSPARLLYCPPPSPSLSLWLSVFTKSTSFLISSLPSTLNRWFIGSSFIFICDVADLHYTERLMCPSSSSVASWGTVCVKWFQIVQV